MEEIIKKHNELLKQLVDILDVVIDKQQQVTGSLLEIQSALVADDYDDTDEQKETDDAQLEQYIDGHSPEHEEL